MSQRPHIKEILEDLTAEERVELSRLLIRSDALLSGDAFIALLARLPRDPGLADDIEAGVRASRATSEAPTSPWDR